MFKKQRITKEESMLVKENQYRAVITCLSNRNGYKASVQRRTGVDEWVKVRCGLKGAVFPTSEAAEAIARYKIREQKSLDTTDKTSSYIIYDD
jgi:hypothetical protein